MFMARTVETYTVISGCYPEKQPWVKWTARMVLRPPRYFADVRDMRRIAVLYQQAHHCPSERSICYQITH